MNTQNDIEAFWKGDFGSEYIARHTEPRMLPAKRFMFETMLAKAEAPRSFMELGTNKGLNLHVLHERYPEAELHGVELNAEAVEIVRGLGFVDSIHHGSLLDAPLDHVCDVAFTVSVLIHVSPESLPQAYDRLHKLSRRYILLCEYHNPTPLEVSYRGHEGRLFKRDFAGEMLDAYSDLRLADHGFFYSRDPRYGLTDSNWFLLEKF